MECYNCGTVIGREEVCRNCGTSVKIYKKIIMASNAYYNDALEKASVRDLSGAIESLKISLRLYKLNIDARNLLGLVYFEMGETVEALTEWVLSKNYKPKNNRASSYLSGIQSNPSKLEAINQTIKKYNQVLLYCRQDSRDLAIIQLKKVISLNPKLVRGHQLLALLYIQDEKYDLAQKALRNAGKIDANNTMTLRYLKEVNTEVRESVPVEPKKRLKSEERFSYQSGNETIIQPKYQKDSSAISTIINMVVGLVIGAAITGFLVVPGVRRQAQNEAKAEVIEANNTISLRNQTISSLEAEIEGLTSQISEAQDSSKNTQSRVSSYEQLLQAYVAYVEKDIETAGMALSNIYTEYLDERSKSIYDTINGEVNADYLKKLYKDGYDAYNRQDYEASIENLEKVVGVDEMYEAGYAIYYLAQAYRKNGDMENAKRYYQKVADLYPNTERAATAQNYLNVE